MKPVRVTIDLSPRFYERLGALEQLVDGGTKANVIRQALQVYEYLVQRTLDGCSFREIDKDGREQTIVFMGVGLECLGPNHGPSRKGA